MQKYGFEINKDLICGENIQQSSQLYNAPSQVAYDILGEDLTYTEICDATVATNIVAEFFDVNAIAIVKMQAPIAVALGKNIEEAFDKTINADAINSFGSIIAVSNLISKETAIKMNALKPKVVIAPKFDEKAIEVLGKTTKLVKLNTELKDYKKIENEEIKVTPFGILVQQKDSQELDKDKFKVVTKTKPSAEQIQDAVFAWKIAKHSKSQAIVIAKDFATSAIVQGQNDPISAIEQALNISCDNCKESILASDMPLNSVENIQDMAQERISLVIQPAGSVNDNDIIKEADKYNLAMIKTGISHVKY